MYQIEGILLEIKNEIQKYFNDSDCYKEIYVSNVNIDYIEIRNTVDRVAVKILFKKLFLMYRLENQELVQSYNKILEIFKSDIDEVFLDISYNNYYWEGKDRVLESWYNKLSSYEDRSIMGFYNRRSKKAEFIMEESRHMPIRDDGYPYKTNLMLAFKIDNIKVKISDPSPIFKLLFKRYISCDLKAWWKYFETINIEGSCKNELNSYLQQALFINNIYNEIHGESILKFGIESQLRHYSNHYEYDTTNTNAIFPESSYEEPIAFYNQAVNGTDETAFLYYYKILEYFFHISKEEAKIDCKSEVICLERVLTALNNHRYIERTIWGEFHDYMLEKDDRNNININTISIKTFSEKLYRYRNSVAHGKADEKTDLLSHVPMNLIEEEEQRKLDGWNSIGNALAYICIEYFCFDNFDLLKFA